MSRHSVVGAFLCASFFLACGERPLRVGEKTTTIVDAAELSHHLGKEVTVEGKTSRIQWQHIIQQRGSKTHVYVDLPGTQIVAYVSEEPRCSGAIRLTGILLEVSSEPKRPGREKQPKELREYQLDVSSWVCLP